MLIAQISDMHIRADARPLSGRIVTRPYLAAAIDAVNARAPDAVLVTGDLTDIGSAEEYALARAELDRLAAPYFVLPGNHDRRDAMRTAFADHAYLPNEGPLDWAIDDFPVRLVGLDSHVPGKAHGEVAGTSLDWLEKALAASTRATIVAIHHPPFPSAIPAMDRIACLNGEALAEVIARHPHVERVVAGHHHRPVQVRWAGTIGQIAPGVAHQVALDLDRRERARWILEPPAFLLHRWEPATGLITHMAYVGDYGGPQDFSGDRDYPPLE